jgi:hypothetical protein
MVVIVITASVWFWEGHVLRRGINDTYPTHLSGINALHCPTQWDN